MISLVLVVVLFLRRGASDACKKWFWPGATALLWGVVSAASYWKGSDTVHPTRLWFLNGTVTLAFGWAALSSAGSVISFWVARDPNIRGGVLLTLMFLWSALLAGTGLNESHPVATVQGRTRAACPARSAAVFA